MFEFEFGDLKLEFVQGNIVNQNDLAAVVNAANAQLRIGGGVAGAVHRAAGPELEKACRSLAPINPGEAVITEAFEMNNDYIIHTLGPVYGVDHPEAEILADCYKNSLKLADENGITSIGFPSISTGAFSYPVKEAAEVCLKTLKDFIPGLKNIKLIRFVLFSRSDYEIYSKKAEKIFSEN